MLASLAMGRCSPLVPVCRVLAGRCGCWHSGCGCGRGRCPGLRTVHFTQTGSLGGGFDLRKGLEAGRSLGHRQREPAS